LKPYLHPKDFFPKTTPKPPFTKQITHTDPPQAEPTPLAHPPSLTPFLVFSAMLHKRCVEDNWKYLKWWDW